VSVQTWVPVVEPQLSLGRLEFFGRVGYGRHKCYAKIDRSWKGHSEYRVWSDSAFDKFMRQSSGIFINIHKKCAAKSPVEPRVPLLLSTGAIVVSTATNLADEKEYDSAFMVVADVSNISRLDISNHIRTRDMSKFRDRFDARQILQRAALL
jgi:hypothetical protein